MFIVGQTITISKDDFIKYAKFGLVLHYNHYDYYYHPTFEEQSSCDDEDSAGAEEVQGYVISHSYLTHEGAEHIWGNWAYFHQGRNFTIVKPPILKILKPRKSL